MVNNDWNARQNRKGLKAYGNVRKGRFKNAQEKKTRTRVKLALKEVQ